MLDIDTFNQACRRYGRRTGLGLAAGVSCLLAAMGLLAAVAGPTSGAVERGDDPMPPWLTGTLIAAMLLLFLAIIGVVEHLAGRDAGLRCPHCGSLLVRFRHLAIATRNCTRCGRRAFAEPTSPPPQRPPPSAPVET